MRYDVVVRSRRAVLPQGEVGAALSVKDGRIAAVDAYDARLKADREEDLGAVALLPGLVDTHVHVNEPGPAGFAAATAEAAAGGVTTILDTPVGAAPLTVSGEALAEKRAAADGQCAVDVGFWGGVVPGNLAELARLYSAGVFGFKCFLARCASAEIVSLDGGMPPLTNAELRAALAQLAALGPDTLLAVHAEDAGEIGQTSGNSYPAFLASRPPRVERRAIEKVVAAAAAAGARAHIANLSAAECVALIAGAKAAGIAITAETCPHYLFFAAEEIRDGATQFKCCPPIRDAINRETLWRGLEGGTIDCVVSGHSPGPTGLKGPAGDFAAARGGISSLQLSLPVVWTVARRRRHGLHDVACWMAERPAALAGLRRKGRLAVGSDADLVAFDPDAAFSVRAATMPHRHPVTPYEGRVLVGVVRRVWLRGEPIAADTARRGRLISRGAP